MKDQENNLWMSVEVDGKVVLKVAMDEDNADWIRAARKDRAVKKSNSSSNKSKEKRNK